jgi:hypothetical protein
MGGLGAIGRLPVPGGVGYLTVLGESRSPRPALGPGHDEGPWLPVVSRRRHDRLLASDDRWTLK